MDKSEYFRLEQAFENAEAWEERTSYVGTEYNDLLPQVEKAREEHPDWYAEYQAQKEQPVSDTSRRAPIDTSRQNPLLHLIGALDAQQRTGNPTDFIPKQEAQGQRSFVTSDTLPTRRNDYGDDNSQKALEAAGVKFGEVVEGDPLFQYVELPQGWKKVPTSHSMWSDLVDEKGRVRARIFYKAAFYDRDAFYSATWRYGVEFDYDREDVGVAHVKDGGTVIYSTEPIKPESEEKSYELSQRAVAAGKAWLDEHYPGWQNPTAYWE